MFSFSTIFGQIISKLIAIVFSIVFGLQGLIGGVSKTPEKTPEDFTPVLRFAVCSDIHLDGSDDQKQAKRLGELFEDSYAYSNTQNYKKLDAVLVAGDFATGGKDIEYASFNNVVEKYCKNETQVLTILGNHEFLEYRDEDASKTYDAYKRMISEDIDFHTVINGFHFIGVSYSEDGKSFKSKKEWLDNELKKATSEDPSKPVFVMNHPAPFGTIYGSVNWGDLDLRSVLSKYSQVVDFSGHSHFCSSDPRTIWQGEFTAVGCGSLSAYMGNLNYIEGDVDAPGESGGFWIVEVDKDGNARLQLYDIENHMFFDYIDYYLTDISCITNRDYSWLNNQLRDTKPKFDDGEVTANVNEEGETIISFPDASGYYEAENYKITISKGAKVIWDDTVISDYVRAPKTGVQVNAGQLNSDTYTIRITAISPYSKVGETIKSSITI